MKVSKLFYALTLNLKAYITTTYHLSFCLVIMSSDDMLYFSDSAEDTSPLDQGLSGLNYLEQQDNLACFDWRDDVEPVALPEKKEPELRPYSERLIFENGECKGDKHDCNALCLLLTQMFSFCCFEFGKFGDTMPTLDHILSVVLKLCNCEVVSVTVIDNGKRLSMYNHFKKVYQVTNERVVYHGTSHANARQICKGGFRSAACQRGKFGKGPYSAVGVFDALAYAEPSPEDLTQTVVVAKLGHGLIGVGHENQVEFGTVPTGEEILTLTNSECSMFCARFEDQLLPTHRVTVRFLTNSKHTPSIHNLVSIYHPTIWDRIKKQTAQPGSVLGKRSAP